LNSEVVPERISGAETRRGRHAFDRDVEIIMFAGRSLDAKCLLCRTLIANLSTLGVPTVEVKVILIEVPPENWGLRGGFPASEIDLGFPVEV
jgi:phenylpyruvate tautomerase PptA (4-oxalocrotonate tautomerase family)